MVYVPVRRGLERSTAVSGSGSGGGERGERPGVRPQESNTSLSLSSDPSPLNE